MSDSASIPTPEYLAELKRSREAELLLRFCDGIVLGDAEMSEVAHILPPAVMANPPAPTLAREASAYAADMDTNKRTIYRWLELGRRNRDACPLDRPAEMLNWWARNMSHRAPTYLEDFVARGKTLPVATISAATKFNPQGAGSPAAAPPAPKDQPLRAAIDMKELGGHGLESGVQILRQNVEALASLLATAYNDPNDERLSQYQSRFEKAVDQLRKAEQSLLALQRARGDLAPRSEFRSDLVNLMLALRGMMRRRADNVCAVLAKALTAEHLGMVRAAVIAESARDDKLLRTARLWQEMPNGEIQLPAA